MDYFIIAAIISAIVIIVLSVVFLRLPLPRYDATQRPRPVGQRDGGPGRVQAVRNQRARMRANAARHQPAFIEEEPNDEDMAGDDQGTANQKQVDFEDKMGAKKRAKLEAKAEKKAAREADEQIREERKKKDLAQEEERRKKEEIQEAEEKKREEEEKQVEEERLRREQEEYLALKAAFTVEGEGFNETQEQGDKENLLQEFLNYIKTQKVVLLEDLAAHFKLKTQAIIDRIAALQADGLLTGVVDDRGKFIYISQKELEDVATFIKQRGRVSITELAESSNNLINLNPVSVP